MRVDLFLKASRLILRRSLAQDLCDAGRVRVNGLPAKSGKEVKAGDVIELRRRERILTVKIRLVPTTKQVSRNDASDLYEVVSEETSADLPSGLSFETE
jgi:ribosomal 50S subunit-recycling heat shock protein